MQAQPKPQLKVLVLMMWGLLGSCTQDRDQCKSDKDCFNAEQCINARCDVVITFSPSAPSEGHIKDSELTPLNSFQLLSGKTRGLTLLGKTQENKFVSWSWSGFEWTRKELREDIEASQFTSTLYYIGPDDELHIIYVDKELKLKHLKTERASDGAERWVEREIAASSTAQELIMAFDADFADNGDMHICAYRGDIFNNIQSNKSLDLLIYREQNGVWTKVLEDRGDHGFYCEIKLGANFISIYELASKGFPLKMLTAQWVVGLTEPQFEVSLLEGYPLAFFEDVQRERMLIHSSTTMGGALKLSYEDKERWHTEQLYQASQTRRVLDVLALPHPDQRAAMTLFLYETNGDGTQPKYIRLDRRHGELNTQEELIDQATPQNLSAVMDQDGFIHMIVQDAEQRLHYQVKP